MTNNEQDKRMGNVIMGIMIDGGICSAHREKGMEQMLSPEVSDAAPTDISSRNLENLWHWTAAAEHLTGYSGWGVMSFPSLSNTCKHILDFFFI